MSTESNDNSNMHPTLALQDVVDKIECFLTSQVDRMEQHVANVEMLSDCESSGNASLLLSQFEVTKSDWQREYESQREELSEDCQRLAEAWERVENEQRQLLAARSIQQTVGSAPPLASEASADIRNKTPTSITPVTGARKSAAPRDPASLTFKQLQQQIRSHKNRHR